MKPFWWVLGILSTLSAQAQAPFTLDPPAGTYSSDILVKAAVSQDFTLDYRFQNSGDDIFIPWEDLPLSALPGEERTFNLMVRARNARSEVYQLAFQYKIAKRDYPPPSPNRVTPVSQDLGPPGVLSPKNGESYHHRPWLILLDLQGRPTAYRVKSGTTILFQGDYFSPTELPSGTGLTLEILVEGAVVVQVNYSAEAQRIPESLPKPGFYRSTLKLLPPLGSWTISLEGAEPQKWTDTWELLPQSNLRATVLVQINSEGKTFKLPYVLDGRAVVSPSAVLKPHIPPLMEVNTPQDGFTFRDFGDGRLQSVGKNIILDNTGKSFDLITQFQDGQVSPPIRMDSSLWMPYFEAPTFLSRNYGLEVRIPEDLQVVYELALDDKNIKTPTTSSPRITSSGLYPAVPRGYLYQTFVKASFLDQQGNLSPVGPVQLLKVDRRIPPSPTVISNGKSFRMEGQGTLLYRLSSGDIPPDEIADLQKYLEPVDFPLTGTPGMEIWWVTALARDEKGNESLVTREKFLVDNRPSGIYGFQGLSTKTVVNFPEISFIPEVAGVTGSLYYTITTDGSEPGDPRETGTLFDGKLTVKAREGEEISVKTRWNLKVGDQWHHQSSVPMEIQLDRKPPQAPKTSLSPGRYEVSESRLEIRASGYDPLDRIFYGLKKGSGETEKLLVEDKLWPSSLALEALESEEAIYQLSLRVVDTAGNMKELAPFLIVLNARKNPPPRLVNQPSGPSQTFRLEFLPTEGIIRYELTRGDVLPDVPSAASPVFPGILDLKAEGGVTTVYQLRAASQSPTGRLSSPTSLFKFVLLPEKKAVSRESSRILETDPPVVKGLPSGNLSSQDLVLTLENSSSYRFALGAGETSAMKVTPLSSTFPEELPVKVIQGRSENFRLLLQHKETKEIFDYSFIIDKEPPAAPIAVLRRSGLVLELTFLPQQDSGFQGSYTKSNFPYPEKNSTGTIVQQVKIPLDQDSWGHFTWEVTAVDSAGNRSETVTKSVVWHHNTLFVDAAALEEGDGSPQSPFRTLERAMSESVGTGVKKLILASGTYDSPSLELSDFVISGGFSSTSWKSGESNPTTLKLVPEASWNIRNFSNLTGLTFTRESGSVPLIQVGDGRISWKNIKISTSGEGEVITFSSSQGTAEGLSVEHKGEKSTVLVALDHSDLEFPKMTLLEDGSNSAVGLKLQDSYLRSDNSKVSMLRSRNAFGTDLSKSTLITTAVDWVIQDTRDSSLLGMLEDSLWTDQDSRRFVGSKSYVTGLFCKNSQIRWQKGSLTMESQTRKASGLELRGRNRASIQDETWTSKGGTILSGDKPENWSWKSMVTSGWDQ